MKAKQHVGQRKIFLTKGRNCYMWFQSDEERHTSKAFH
jgi:hypothetical protein